MNQIVFLDQSTKNNEMKKKQPPSVKTYSICCSLCLHINFVSPSFYYFICKTMKRMQKNS